MIRFAVLLVAVVLSWTPVGTGGAQASDAPQAIYDSFEALLGRRDVREIYALPPERYWRATGPLQVTIAGGGNLGLVPVLDALAGEFGRASAIEIDVRAWALAIMPEAGQAGDLTILVVSRPLGAEFAAGLGIDVEMRRRFADGRWPALFEFRRDDLSATGRRRGIVLLADDLGRAEIETFLALSMVWTLGGASIGDELGAIVDVGERSRLTDRGRRVFALMYDPALTLGQPLDEARGTARRLLGLAD